MTPSQENAEPNCPRCGLPLKQYEVWDTKRPRERCAWMCIPCKKAGYCMEGRGRTFAEAAADVRDQNIPENTVIFSKGRTKYGNGYIISEQPDWDKIKKLAQRMNGLVDEIEKEIESGESRPFQNCFEDCPLGRGSE